MYYFLQYFMNIKLMSYEEPSSTKFILNLENDLDDFLQN